MSKEAYFNWLSQQSPGICSITAPLSWKPTFFAENDDTKMCLTQASSASISQSWWPTSFIFSVDEDINS